MTEFDKTKLHVLKLYSISYKYNDEFTDGTTWARIQDGKKTLMNEQIDEWVLNKI